jgi:hypothetical protein
MDIKALCENTTDACINKIDGFYERMSHHYKNIVLVSPRILIYCKCSKTEGISEANKHNQLTGSRSWTEYNQLIRSRALTGHEGKMFQILLVQSTAKTEFTKSTASIST